MKAYTAFVIVAAIIGGIAINVIALLFLLFFVFIALGVLGINMAEHDLLTKEFQIKLMFASYVGIIMYAFSTLWKYNRSHARHKNTQYEAVVFFVVPTIVFFLDILQPESFMLMCSGITAIAFYERIAIRYKKFGLYRV